ncbi:MAG: hypothetical protein KJZ80_18850 [Hyphomicrobiaceae bacterium]|nr:hypothetical protein [Hyphomicrobiaceae bacterium]
MRALFFAIPAIAAVGLGAAVAASQERQGRYAMSPAENGFARLDTETGAMSLCSRRDGKWVCELMEDEAKTLREEVERLRAEVQRLEEQAALADRTPGEGPRAERPGTKLELPSEEDIDKALDYVERIFRKFRDRIREFDNQNQERKGTQL